MPPPTSSSMGVFFSGSHAANTSGWLRAECPRFMAKPIWQKQLSRIFDTLGGSKGGGTALIPCAMVEGVWCPASIARRSPGNHRVFLPSLPATKLLITIGEIPILNHKFKIARKFASQIGGSNAQIITVAVQTRKGDMWVLRVWRVPVV